MTQALIQSALKYAVLIRLLENVGVIAVVALGVVDIIIVEDHPKWLGHVIDIARHIAHNAGVANQQQATAIGHKAGK